MAELKTWLLYVVVMCAAVILVWLVCKALVSARWRRDRRGPTGPQIEAKGEPWTVAATGLEEASQAAWARQPHGFAPGGMHQVAERYGFHRTDVDGETILYCHPARGDLFTYRDGSWDHVAPGGKSVRGTGVAELREYLAGLFAKDISRRKPN